ncbi:Lrp/AsnC family transcriptional regulator [Sulfitobacter sp. M22]|uniref:Lrp/AsnC family transcriptional regulator n=1 Tax=Sulfitobacter sp. M22 TaxID=2675332 RepID=UPI001F235D8F|nr:Lrp/AsnC family transcriptional regulator [Sulfitobacter sp. M22]MCF7728129.1 AsnC family transcriptional regulator [Sulfitobacter sp. M22]
MDRVDCLILDAMQHNARIAIADLAERVGASTASVQRRLKRMRTDGTIKAEVAVIDPRRSGFSITALITVELERDSADRTDAFKRRALDESRVQQCYCVAGDSDFVVVAILRDMDDYETFTARFFQDENVRHYRSSIVVSRVKTSVHVPVTAGM